MTDSGGILIEPPGLVLEDMKAGAAQLIIDKMAGTIVVFDRKELHGVRLWQLRKQTKAPKAFKVEYAKIGAFWKR
jgi:hypothetical protein